MLGNVVVDVKVCGAAHGSAAAVCPGIAASARWRGLQPQRLPRALPGDGNLGTFGNRYREAAAAAKAARCSVPVYIVGHKVGPGVLCDSEISPVAVLMDSPAGAPKRPPGVKPAARSGNRFASFWHAGVS